MDPDQTAPMGSTLFASIFKLVNNVMQLFAADNIFRCIFVGTLSFDVNGPVHAYLCIFIGTIVGS